MSRKKAGPRGKRSRDCAQLSMASARPPFVPVALYRCGCVAFYVCLGDCWVYVLPVPRIRQSARGDHGGHSLHTLPLTVEGMGTLAGPMVDVLAEHVVGAPAPPLPPNLFIAQQVLSGAATGTPMAVWHQPCSVLTELLIGTQGHQEASLEKCVSTRREENAEGGKQAWQANPMFLLMAGSQISAGFHTHFYFLLLFY